jgi:transketolase
MENTPVVTKLAVRAMPTSGTPSELLSAAGIDAEHIAQAVRESLFLPARRAEIESSDTESRK